MQADITNAQRCRTGGKPSAKRKPARVRPRIGAAFSIGRTTRRQHPWAQAGRLSGDLAGAVPVTGGTGASIDGGARCSSMAQRKMLPMLRSGTGRLTAAKPVCPLGQRKSSSALASSRPIRLNPCSAQPTFVVRSSSRPLASGSMRTGSRLSPSSPKGPGPSVDPRPGGEPVSPDSRGSSTRCLVGLPERSEVLESRPRANGHVGRHRVGKQQQPPQVIQQELAAPAWPSARRPLGLSQCPKPLRDIEPRRM